MALWPCDSVTSFPSRARAAFLAENAACGTGVGREEGVGEAVAAAVSVPQSVFSLFSAWLPVFSHHRSSKQQAASGAEDGVEVCRLEEASGDTCKRFGCRFWKRRYMLMCFSGCDPAAVCRRSGSLSGGCCGLLLRNALPGAA